MEVTVSSILMAVISMQICIKFTVVNTAQNLAP